MHAPTPYTSAAPTSGRAAASAHPAAPVAFADAVELFIGRTRRTKTGSPNTERAYRCDLAGFRSFIQSRDEAAFYDALAENASAAREMQDEQLCKLAVELTGKLRRSTTVDWQKRESVRAKLRILVRRLLAKYEYPPDQQAGAVELVLKQAEALADGWTR